MSENANGFHGTMAGAILTASAPSAVMDSGRGRFDVHGRTDKYSVVRHDLREYYSKVARDHDQVYADTRLHSHIAPAMDPVSVALAGRDVLDIGCGTGYWTQEIARVADRVHAVDYCLDMVRRAEKRTYACPVRITLDNALTLDRVSSRHSGAFLGFFWRHIPRILVRTFLETLHERLVPGGVVVIMDSGPGRFPRKIEGASERDQFYRKELPDGSVYDVIHNVPSQAELRAFVSEYAHDAQYFRYGDVFVFTYTLKSEAVYE
ncbi:MAG: class I SAM-dependent methyltransferase [Spirochaetia bacterium]|nr:class I SAM-dependent methyltransferase [Spirochaetia bacterium]